MKGRLVNSGYGTSLLSQDNWNVSGLHLPEGATILLCSNL